MTAPDDDAGFENDEVTYLLTFKDGTKVSVGQLEAWLQMIRDDPETSGSEIKLAETIVRGIRARMNLAGVV